MFGVLDDRSDSVRRYGSAALAYFGEGESRLRLYEDARKRFEEMIPEWELWVENMLVTIGKVQIHIVIFLQKLIVA